MTEQHGDDFERRVGERLRVHAGRALGEVDARALPRRLAESPPLAGSPSLGGCGRGATMVLASVLTVSVLQLHPGERLADARLVSSGANTGTAHSGSLRPDCRADAAIGAGVLADDCTRLLAWRRGRTCRRRGRRERPRRSHHRRREDLDNRLATGRARGPARGSR